MTTTVIRRPLVTPARLVGGFVAIGGLVLGSAYAASADPDADYPSQAQVDQARAAVAGVGARAAALEQSYAVAALSVARLQERASRLGEVAKGARLELTRRTRDARAAAARATAAEATSQEASASVRSYASAIYQQGGSIGSLQPLLEADGAQELADRASTLAVVGDLRAQDLKDATLAAGTARSLRSAADGARDAQASAERKAADAHTAAKGEFAAAKAQAAALEATRAATARELARLRDSSAALERRRLDGLARDAEERAAQRPPGAGGGTTRPTSTSTSTRPAGTTTSTSRPTSTSTSTQPSSTTTTPTSTTTTEAPPPPPSGGASAAVAYAQAQLGKPYEWGADGPDSFDCSGLTLMAWQQAGVYLSHYTGAQYAETTRVAISDLAAGDLVFFGASGESSYHMGMYVGGGQMIEAPRTGLNVRYSSIYRSDLVPYGGRPS